MHHERVAIPARRGEVAELVVQRPAVIDFDLGVIGSQIIEFIELASLVLARIDTEHVGVAGQAVVSDHGFSKGRARYLGRRVIPELQQFRVGYFTLLRLVCVVLPLDTGAGTGDVAHNTKHRSVAAVAFLDIGTHVAWHLRRGGYPLLCYDNLDIRVSLLADMWPAVTRASSTHAFTSHSLRDCTV